MSSNRLVLYQDLFRLPYNTRVNYREYEVSSSAMFRELFCEWGIKDMSNLYLAKDAFFSYFLRRNELYPETEQVLNELKKEIVRSVYLPIRPMVRIKNTARNGLA
jgi:hypothetical protein